MAKWLIIRNFTIGNGVLHEKMPTMKIFIDNGHGIDTHGKHSPDGRFLEYKFNREMAERIVSGLINRGLDAELLVGDFGSLHADTHVCSLGVIEPDNPFQYASAFIPCRYRYLVKPFNLQYSVRIFHEGDDGFNCTLLELKVIISAVVIICCNRNREMRRKWPAGMHTICIGTFRFSLLK